jgi:hypothetical protein
MDYQQETQRNDEDFRHLIRLNYLLYTPPPLLTFALLPDMQLTLLALANGCDHRCPLRQ